MQRMGCLTSRFAVLLAMVTIALLIFGGNGVLDGIKYRQPVTLTFEQFVQQKPTAGWFHITGTVIDVLHEGHIVERQKYTPPSINQRETDMENLKRAYIPVYDANTFSEGPEIPALHLILFTGDPDIIRTIQDMSDNIYPSSSKETVLAYLKKHEDKILLKRDIEGMVKAGLGSESSENRKLLESKLNRLDPNYVVLDDGAKPMLGAGAGMFVLGLALLAAQILYYARNLIRR